MRNFIGLLVFFPPVAVAIAKPESLPLNIVLTLLGYIPGIIHAMICVSEYLDRS